MKRLAVIISIGFSATALAQDPATTDTTPTTTTNDSLEGDVRPEGNSIGLGAGWVFPGAQLLQPNTASARFRFGKIAVEPAVQINNRSHGVKTTTNLTAPPADPVETNDEDKDGQLDLAFGANVRIPLASRGPVDLLIIPGLLFDFGATSLDPNVHQTDIVNRTRNSEMTIALAWGFGLEWFFRRNFSFSADVSNPLLSFTSATDRTEAVANAGGNTITQTNNQGDTTFNVGLIFNPQVRAMLHMYF